jgi:hypothetical protein
MDLPIGYLVISCHFYKSSYLKEMGLFKTGISYFPVLGVTVAVQYDWIVSMLAEPLHNHV